MKQILLVGCCLLLLCGQAQIKLDSTKSFEQNYSDHYHPWLKYGTFIPRNMDECMIVLKSSPRYDKLLLYEREEIYQKLFEEEAFGVHQNWDLKCHSVLAQYFYNRGIYSTRKMEATVLYCYYQVEVCCNYDFESIMSEVASTFATSEKLAYKLLKKEFKDEKRLHKRIQRKSKREYKRSIRWGRKGEEFDMFFD